MNNCNICGKELIQLFTSVACPINHSNNIIGSNDTRIIRDLGKGVWRHEQIVHVTEMNYLIAGERGWYSNKDRITDVLAEVKSAAEVDWNGLDNIPGWCCEPAREGHTLRGHSNYPATCVKYLYKLAVW